MFYADQRDKFGVEYYGTHAQWFYDVIISGRTDEYRLHTYAGVKHLSELPGLTISGRGPQADRVLWS